MKAKTSVKSSVKQSFETKLYNDAINKAIRKYHYMSQVLLVNAIDKIADGKKSEVFESWKYDVEILKDLCNMLGV